MLLHKKVNVNVNALTQKIVKNFFLRFFVLTELLQNFW